MVFIWQNSKTVFIFFVQVEVEIDNYSKKNYTLSAWLLKKASSLINQAGGLYGRS